MIDPTADNEKAGGPPPAFSTRCHECVFAEWRADPADPADPAGPPLQSGCAHRRLDRYAEVEPVRWEAAGDDGRVAAVIPGRLCNLARRRPWGEGQELGELLTLSRREARPRWKGQVVARGDDLPLVERSLKSLAAQSIPPKSVVLILIRPSERDEVAAFDLLAAHFPGVRHTASAQYAAADWRDAMVNEYLRESPRAGNYAYLLTLMAGDEAPAGLVADLDAAANDRLEDIDSRGGGHRSPPLWANALLLFAPPEGAAHG